MMYCKTCGKLLDEDVKVCNGCGADPKRGAKKAAGSKPAGKSQSKNRLAMAAGILLLLIAAGVTCWSTIRDMHRPAKPAYPSPMPPVEMPATTPEVDLSACEAVSYGQLMYEPAAYKDKAVVVSGEIVNASEEYSLIAIADSADSIDVMLVYYKDVDWFTPRAGDQIRAYGVSSGIADDVYQTDDGQPWPAPLIIASWIEGEG